MSASLLQHPPDVTSRSKECANNSRISKLSASTPFAPQPSKYGNIFANERWHVELRGRRSTTTLWQKI
jgi:hypothetical protein